jgi:hypothetical protein
MRNPRAYLGNALALNEHLTRRDDLASFDIEEAGRMKNDRRMSGGLGHQATGKERTEEFHG